MSQTIQLRGIAWDHSRAFPPLVATAQRYEETHPGIRIRWEKRTLDEFGHKPVDELARQFDLIVIDHPWAGFAFEKGLVVDLNTVLSAGAIAELEANSIGRTFHSYDYYGKLLALPIDAATPAPSWRVDIMERHGVRPPNTWAEAVAISRRKLAVIPGFNADLFLHFLMLVKGLGADICNGDEEIAPHSVLRTAVELLRELVEPMPQEIYNWNPIQVAELMTRTDEFAWNAFAYTYNNYARLGFAASRLRFGNLISLEAGRSRLQSVLGGTGVAISASCKAITSALNYALFIASGNTQRSIYLQAGGQPSHRSAWDDEAADVLCGGFFRDTRATQDEAFVRPRYNGYVPLQTVGGVALQEHLRDGRGIAATLRRLNELYRLSQTPT
jgi:multiple sugar transport system substrate-binding protein